MRFQKVSRRRIAFLGAMLGFIAGCAATYTLAVRPAKEELSNAVVYQVLSDTRLALRQDTPKGISQQIVMSLPNHARMLHMFYSDNPQTPKALRSIRAVYTRRNLPVPVEIAPLFATLPPEKSKTQ